MTVVVLTMIDSVGAGETVEPGRVNCEGSHEDCVLTLSCFFVLVFLKPGLPVVGDGLILSLIHRDLPVSAS